MNKAKPKSLQKFRTYLVLLSTPFLILCMAHNCARIESDGLTLSVRNIECGDTQLRFENLVYDGNQNGLVRIANQLKYNLQNALLEELPVETSELSVAQILNALEQSCAQDDDYRGLTYYRQEKKFSNQDFVSVIIWSELYGSSFYSTQEYLTFRINDGSSLNLHDYITNDGRDSLMRMFTTSVKQDLYAYIDKFVQEHPSEDKKQLIVMIEQLDDQDIKWENLEMSLDSLGNDVTLLINGRYILLNNSDLTSYWEYSLTSGECERWLKGLQLNVN